MKSTTVFVTGITLLILAAGITTVYQVGLPEDEADTVNQVHYKKAVMYFDKEHYEYALREFDAIEGEFRSDWRVLYYRGSSMIKLEQFDEAIPLLAQAFEQNPGEAKLPFTLGVAYYKLGEIVIAKGYFRTALDLDPSNEDAKGLMDVMASLEHQPEGREQPPVSSHRSIHGT